MISQTTDRRGSLVYSISDARGNSLYQSYDYNQVQMALSGFISSGRCVAAPMAMGNARSRSYCDVVNSRNAYGQTVYEVVRGRQVIQTSYNYNEAVEISQSARGCLY
jgi:hypothetical protein